jgi:hypothetical protein
MHAGRTRSAQPSLLNTIDHSTFVIRDAGVNAARKLGVSTHHPSSEPRKVQLLVGIPWQIYA